MIVTLFVVVIVVIVAVSTVSIVFSTAYLRCLASIQLAAAAHLRRFFYFVYAPYHRYIYTHTIVTRAERIDRRRRKTTPPMFEVGPSCSLPSRQAFRLKPTMSTSTTSPLDRPQLLSGIDGLLRHHQTVLKAQKKSMLFSDDTPIHMVLTLHQVPPARVRPIRM
jgi:DNA-directed RNA polymerase beta' subunit